MLKLKNQKNKVKKLFNQLKYSQKDNIIGDLNNDNYVQFLSVLKGYHKIKELNGKICVFYLENWDLRKKLICPVCGHDLSFEICGKQPPLNANAKRLK